MAGHSGWIAAIEPPYNSMTRTKSITADILEFMNEYCEGFTIIIQ